MPVWKSYTIWGLYYLPLKCYCIKTESLPNNLRVNIIFDGSLSRPSSTPDDINITQTIVREPFSPTSSLASNHLPSEKSGSRQYLNSASKNRSHIPLAEFELGLSSTPGSRAVSSTPGSRAVSSTPDSRAVSSTPGSRAVSSTPGSNSRAVSSTPGSRAVSSTPGSRVVSSTPDRRDEPLLLPSSNLSCDKPRIPMEITLSSDEEDCPSQIQIWSAFRFIYFLKFFKSFNRRTQPTKLSSARACTVI